MESHPVEIAEYAVARGIDGESAYAWWVSHTLQKRDIIISVLHHSIRKTTHKYGIEIPIIKFSIIYDRVETWVRIICTSCCAIRAY